MPVNITKQQACKRQCISQSNLPTKINPEVNLQDVGIEMECNPGILEGTDWLPAIILSTKGDEVLAAAGEGNRFDAVAVKNQLTIKMLCFELPYYHFCLHTVCTSYVIQLSFNDN